MTPTLKLFLPESKLDRCYILVEVESDNMHSDQFIKDSFAEHIGLLSTHIHDASWDVYRDYAKALGKLFAAEAKARYGVEYQIYEIGKTFAPRSCPAWKGSLDPKDW